MSKELPFIPNIFRGVEYPRHFKFIVGADEELIDGQVIGCTDEQVVVEFGGKPDQPGQLLVWDQGNVIGVSPK